MVEYENAIVRNQNAAMNVLIFFKTLFLNKMIVLFSIFVLERTL